MSLGPAVNRVKILNFNFSRTNKNVLKNVKCDWNDGLNVVRAEANSI